MDLFKSLEEGKLYDVSSTCGKFVGKLKKKGKDFLIFEVNGTELGCPNNTILSVYEMPEPVTFYLVRELDGMYLLSAFPPKRNAASTEFVFEADDNEIDYVRHLQDAEAFLFLREGYLLHGHYLDLTRQVSVPLSEAKPIKPTELR